LGVRPPPPGAGLAGAEYPASRTRVSRGKIVQNARHEAIDFSAARPDCRPGAEERAAPDRGGVCPRSDAPEVVAEASEGSPAILKRQLHKPHERRLGARVIRCAVVLRSDHCLETIVMGSEPMHCVGAMVRLFNNAQEDPRCGCGGLHSPARFSPGAPRCDCSSRCRNAPIQPPPGPVARLRV